MHAPHVRQLCSCSPATPSLCRPAAVGHGGAEWEILLGWASLLLWHPQVWAPLPTPEPPPPLPDSGSPPGLWTGWIGAQAGDTSNGAICPCGTVVRVRPPSASPQPDWCPVGSCTASSLGLLCCRPMILTLTLPAVPWPQLLDLWSDPTYSGPNGESGALTGLTGSCSGPDAIKLDVSWCRVCPSMLLPACLPACPPARLPACPPARLPACPVTAAQGDSTPLPIHVPPAGAHRHWGTQQYYAEHGGLFNHGRNLWQVY